MHTPKTRARILALLLGVTALVLTGWASADPPARVARLGYTSGAVSFSPAGENDWVQARVNRPLITGDRLWVDAGARAELQVGSAVIRMGGSTSVTLLNLEDRVAQVQLAQGTLNIRVRRFDARDVLEIDTPNLAYSIRRAGEYRIDVDPAGYSTTAVVRSGGRAEVYGDGRAYVVNAQQAYRFAGTDLSDYEYIGVPRADEFDRWSSDRDRRGTVSARYVSRDVIGYEDLDEHGSWRATEGYGNVWVPNRVAPGWAPYHDGHWAWVEPWGWTWVDDAPWGFAVSHYGRWANIRGTWGWVPGPVRSRAVYAPALVAFVGGSNFQIAISSGNVPGVAWFPLGPRDVYRPSYPVSQRYFNNINTTNTTINTTNITNVYNIKNVRNITYVNQQVPGAVVAVPRNSFVQSQQVGSASVRLSKEASAKSEVTARAAVAPVQDSVRGGAAQGKTPPEESQKRQVVVKAKPPAAPIAFSAKQAELAKDPGKPLDARALAAVKPPAAPKPAPSVKVVSPAPPAVAPPKQQAVAAGGPQAPEAKKGPQPSEAKKGPPVREAGKGSQPPASAQKSPEARQAQQPPEAQKGPQASEAKNGTLAREGEKALQPPVSVPRPPEARATLPPMSAPATPEAQKTPPVASVSKPPEAPEGTLPEVQKGPRPKPDAASVAEKRAEKEIEQQLKRDEKLRVEKLRREEEDENRRP